MSNPAKQWSWGGALGRATGTAIGGASTGAIAGSLGGPLGVPLGAAVFGGIGFTSSLIGSALGHWWDDISREEESFGSGALYTLVVAGALMLFATLLAQPMVARVPDPTLPLGLLIGFVSIVASASKSLIDDLHHAYFGTPRTTTTDMLMLKESVRADREAEHL